MLNSYIPALSKRYALLSNIGSGGMGTVFHAHDRLNNQDVALKGLMIPPAVLDELSAAGVDLRTQLAREFALLATLRHPHIISVYDFGFDHNGQPFFTMELLHQARGLVDFGRKQPPAVQESLLMQMLQALSYLHRYGVLHCDIKPDNVLVTPDGVAHMLDFGLATARGTTPTGSGSSMGTLPYAAPELLDGSPPDARSDLYALGMVMAELLAGHYPFEDAASLTDLITAIQTQPIDVDALPASPALRGVLAKLLSKNPAARYASADQALLAFAKALNATDTVETPAIRESFLQASKLIGRDAELNNLTAALDSAVSGTGAAWLIGGESGVGKTRLMNELRIAALVRGALVLRAQASTEAGTSFRFWRDALRYLALLVDVDDYEASILKPIIPDIDTVTGRPAADPPPIDPVAAQERLGAVIERLFTRLDMPALMLLEDLQWLPEGLGIVQRLSRLAARRPLLIVANYRDDERPALPRELPQMAHIHLNRLDRAAISDLSASMLGDEAGRRADLIEFLMQQTEGNVFFLVETVRALADEAGALHAIGDTPIVADLVATGVRAVVERRLRRISGADEALLKLAALMGRQLDLRAMARAAAGYLSVEEWLVRCASVLEVQDDLWRFAHDKLREAVLASITPAEAPGLHHAIATALEAEYGDDRDAVVRQAHHWGQAGDRAKELYYSALAGETLLSLGAYREADQRLRRALELAEGGGMGRAGRARIARLLADVSIGLGMQLECMAFLRQAHHALTAEYPNADLAAQVAGLSADELRLLTDIELELGYNYLEQTTDPLTGLNFLEHAIALQERLNDDPLMLANCLAVATLTLTTAREQDRATRYAAQAADLLAAVPPETAPAAVARARSNLAYYWTFAARWDESFRDGEVAADLYRRIGDPLRLRATLMNLATSYEWRGDFAQGLAMRFNEYEAGRKADNLTGQIRALAGVGQIQAYLGRLDEARASLETRAELIVRTNSVASTRFTYLGMVYYRLGLLEAAREALPKAVAEVSRIVVPTGHDMFSIPNTAEVLLGLWEEGAENVETLRGFAPTVMQRVMQYGERYQAGEAHMLTIEGRYRWLLGETEGALALWRRAIALADARSTPYAGALARYEIGRRAAAGSPERASLLAEARTMLQGMGAGYAAALAERALVG